MEFSVHMLKRTCRFDCLHMPLSLQGDDDGLAATSMEYLDTILENAEYIDTVQGKLPLAEAAKMIAKDRSKHTELFDRSHVKNVRKDCYKRLALIGFSFLCLFASFFTLRNLQSSNSGSDPTLGLITFGCLQSLMWLGALISSPILSKIRPKWTLVVASAAFTFYAVANFYPAKYTLIPCSLLAGCGVGILWIAEGIYMINLAATYALVSKKPMMEVVSKFNGVVFTMMQCSHFIGNLLSSIILSEDINWFPNRKLGNPKQLSNFSAVGPANTTGHQPSATCGLDFYSQEQTVQSVRNVDPIQNMVLLAILTALALIGFLTLCALLPPLKILRTTGNNSILTNLKSFIRMFRNPRVLLLVFYMMYPGLSGSVAMADYTKVLIKSSKVKYFVITKLVDNSRFW